MAPFRPTRWLGRLARAGWGRLHDRRSSAARQREDLARLRALAEQLPAHLVHRAFHDPLTDLPHRALLIDRLAHALTAAKRDARMPAVLFIDLDNFKGVNDRWGHVVGDQVLVAVAHRLRSCVRPGDTVARLGGDEFAVLLEGVSDRRVAVRAGERIAAALKVPIALPETEATVGASIGIALATSADDAAEELVSAADRAMYRAKRAGGGRVVSAGPMPAAGGEPAGEMASQR